MTLGRILSDSSSIFMNLGSNFNTNHKKLKGENDIHSGSLSYFKAFKKAKKMGVEMISYDCSFGNDNISVNNRINLIIE